MSTASDVPDVCRLQAETLPAADFPVSRRQDFRVFFNPGVHAQIWKHASEDLSVEICGVLVGLWQRDDAGPFAVVSEYIRCDSAKSGFAEVTFTHESWTKINAQMDSKFTNLKIIGWYHSHPNFGIFLSDRDVFIQENFFSGAGQIAHVVDPVRKIDGVFTWKAGKPALSAHFWVGDRICVTEDEPAEISARSGEGAAMSAQMNAAAAEKSSSLLASLTTVALMGCLFLLGFLLRGNVSEWSRRLERERELVGIIAYFAEHKLLRPDLDDNLSALGAYLHAVAANAGKLAELSAKRDGREDEALKEAWGQVSAGLADAEKKLNHIREKDLLTPEEELVVKDAEKELVRIILERDARRLEARLRASSEADPERQKDERQKGASSPGEAREKPATAKLKPAADKSKPATEKSKPATDKAKPEKKE